MNRSKKLIGALIVIAAFFFTSSAMAATCSNAKVTLAGPNAAFINDTGLQITCISGASGWAAGLNVSISQTVHPDIKDQVLATALTAISLGRNVYVISDTGAVGGLLSAMYLQNN